MRPIRPTPATPEGQWRCSTIRRSCGRRCRCCSRWCSSTGSPGAVRLHSVTARFTRGLTQSLTGAAVAINLQTIERAINQINTAWNRPEQIYNNQLTGQICYMDYAQGDRLEFYMRLDGQADEDKGDTETRNSETRRA